MLEYKTSDMWFAAYLLCEGGMLLSIENGRKARKVFHLSCKVNQFSDASQSFYSRQARVDPLRYKHYITDLRSALSTRVLPITTKEENNGASSEK